MPRPFSPALIADVWPPPDDRLPMVALVGALIGVGVLLARLRTRLSPELARKLLHVAVGVAAFGLPWLTESTVSVAWLAALSVVGVVGLRAGVPGSAGVADVLYATGRRGWGEAAFALGVLVLFARHEPGAVEYPIAIAIVTVADAAAALVGQRWGATNRSVTRAGSAAFFGCAFAITLAGLIGQVGGGSALVAGLVVATTTTLAEAVTSGGWDNFTVPVTAAAALHLVG